MKVEIFTDGSAQTAETDGGWAYVLIVDGEFHSEGSGRAEKVTNNDMELEAAIQGLKAVYCTVESPVDDFDIVLCSDSQLVLGWASGEYKFKQVNKMDKYEQLRGLMDRLSASTKWIKGHSGHKYNDRCDYLANQARLGLELEKKKESAKSTGSTLIGKKKEGIVCLWFGNKLKVVSLVDNIIEDYDREVHGKRGSAIEIREERSR